MSECLCFRELSMGSAIRHLLRMLAIFDALSLASMILMSFRNWDWLRNYENRFTIVMWSTLWLHVITMICLNASIWTTMAVLVERFLAICKGVKSNRYHLTYTAPIIITSILWNLRRLFELTVEHVVEPDYEAVILTFTELRHNETYMTVVSLIDALICHLIPILITVVLQVLVYKTVSKGTTNFELRQDHSIATMVSLVPLVLAPCLSITIFFKFYDVVTHGKYYEYLDWIEIVSEMSTIGVAINSSVKIGLYCAKNPTFRNLFLESLRLKRKSTTIATSNHLEENVMMMS